MVFAVKSKFKFPLLKILVWCVHQIILHILQTEHDVHCQMSNSFLCGNRNFGTVCGISSRIEVRQNCEMSMEKMSIGKTKITIRKHDKIKLYLDLAWDIVGNGFEMGEKTFIQNSKSHFMQCTGKRRKNARTNEKKNWIFICQDKYNIILFHESSICLLFAVSLLAEFWRVAISMEHPFYNWKSRCELMRTILK